MPRRESAYGRLLHHFHTHPRGRLHEMLFFSGIGAALGFLDLLAWRAGELNDPLALILAVIAACFVLFSLLPQKRVAPPPPAVGKRGELREALKKGKAEGRRKGPPPPVQ